ncbi:MAG: hypothetical protein ABI091_14735 [Ferruginibacter sp.]
MAAKVRLVVEMILINETHFDLERIDPNWYAVHPDSYRECDPEFHYVRRGKRKNAAQCFAAGFIKKN